MTKPFYQERWSKEIGFMPSGSAAELRAELTDAVRRHIMSEVCIYFSPFIALPVFNSYYPG